MAAASPIPKKELTAIRAQLTTELEELRRQGAELEQASFGSNQSDLSGEVAFDEEFADAGSSTFERERDLSLSKNIRDLVEKVEHAIGRIDGGSYGICERCGKPIQKARLKALPYASLCIDDAQAEVRPR